jgi:hypothetical protein
MAYSVRTIASNSRCFVSGSLLALVLLLSACKTGTKADNDQATQMAMWLDNVPELKNLNVSNAEIDQLSDAHNAGLSDPSAVALIKHARSRQKPFVEGEAVADILSAGISEQTVLQLDQMNQLGAFAGQAVALRLVGFSDKLILAVAQRHAQGLPVLSGEKLGELKNTGASEATILEMVQNGTSEKTASEYIASRERAAGGHSFVFQGHHKKS